MAGQRMTRETFDAVVHDKMKRYRITADQAMSDTLRQLEGPSAGRRPINDTEPPYRDKRRYMRDLPHGSADRSRDMEMRRDGSQSYLHELDREPYGERNVNPFSDRWSSSDPIVKERLYREELNATKHRLSEFESMRSLDRGELLSRDLRRRSWDLDHPLHGPDLDVGRSEMFRDSRSPPSELGPVMDVFKSPGSMGQVPLKRREKKGPAQHEQSEDFTLQDPTKKSSAFSSMCIVKWAKFNTMGSDTNLARQRKFLFKQTTNTCQTMVDCFKRPMSSYYRNLCFGSVKPLALPALKTPKIDNDLLDLLIKTRTVTVKNDFFEVIKPYDMDMMMIQQRLLKCTVPLLLVSNSFELRDAFVTNPRKLLTALNTAVLQCQRSMVLIGQTFAMITSARQERILDVLSVRDPSLKASAYPNFKNCFLFGNEFMWKLKTWLKNKDNKFVLKTPAKLSAANNASVPKEEDLKTAAESRERKTADPKVVAAIDQLLENAKKGAQADRGKSEFWFLFDEGSNEYKYYRQKFEEFRKSKGRIHTQSTQTKTCKRSPEELACESVRAMLYARKAQTVKRRLYKTLAFSRKRKQAKLKRRATKAPPPVQVEEVIKKEEQVLEVTPTEQTTAENAAAKVEVKPQKTPEKCSVSDNTDAQIDVKLPEEKKPVAAEAQAADVDEKTKDTAIKLAQFVAQMGPEIEQFSMENSVNNPEFWFLCEKESPAYKFYRSKVEEFKQDEQDATSDDGDIGLEDGDLENIRTGDESQNDSDLEIDAECEAAEAPSAESAPVAAFSPMPTPVRPPIARKRVANLKVGMLPPKRVCLVEEPKVHDPVRIDYDRPRGRGYNRRKKPADLEFADKKLNQQNVGFQMLSKMGWQDGQGLGSRGSGIKNPINVGAVSAGEGLGADEQKPGKSANFDAFRQRMIQMYRKLPNKKVIEDY